MNRFSRFTVERTLALGSAEVSWLRRHLRLVRRARRLEVAGLRRVGRDRSLDASILRVDGSDLERQIADFGHLLLPGGGRPRRAGGVEGWYESQG
jgi:hypothetical protein